MERKTPSHAAGFSLVEMLVAITIGLVLLTGLVTTSVNTNKNYGEMAKANRQIENGRYALQILHDEIRLAGMYGQWSGTGLTAPAILPDPCQLPIAGITDGLTLHIQGYDGGAGAPGCLTDLMPGTDVLVIRRTSTTATPLAGLDANTWYVQGRGPTLRLAQGSAGAATFNLMTTPTLTPPQSADIRQYIQRIYYVSRCSNANPCDGIPTLRRYDLQAGGAFQDEPLVEGIENMQLVYGVDNVIPVGLTTGNGAPDVYDSDPTTVEVNPITAWTDVMTVQVHLLARNVEPTPGYSDDKTYDLGGVEGVQVVAPADEFKRHVFSEVVRAVNPSSRRENQN